MEHYTLPPSQTSLVVSEVLDSDTESTESNETIKMDGSPEVAKQSVHSIKELESLKLSDSELAIFNTIQGLSKAPSLEDNDTKDSEKRRSILTQSFHPSVLPQKLGMPGGPMTNAVQQSYLNGLQLSENTTFPSYRQSQAYPQTVLPQLPLMSQEQSNLPQVSSMPSPVMYNMMQYNTMQGPPLAYPAFQRPPLLPYAYQQTPFFQQRMQFPATIQQFNQYRAPYVHHTVPVPQLPMHYQMPFCVPPVPPHSHNPLSSNLISDNSRLLFSALDDSLQRLGVKVSLEGENPIEELKKVKQITEGLKLEFLKLSERMMLCTKQEAVLCEMIKKLKTSQTVKVEEMEQNVNLEIKREANRNQIQHIQMVKTEVSPDIKLKSSKGTLEPELPCGNGQELVEDSKPRNEIALSKSQNETIKLRKSPNPWKPRRFKQNTSDGADENNEKAYRTVQGILNKLTPQNLDALIKQIEDLEIHSEERLKKVVDLICTNAINEPKYNTIFAFMCNRLALLKVPLADQEGSVTFRKVLLEKCQEEFLQQGRSILTRLGKMQLIDHTKGEDKMQLIGKFTEEEKKTQRRKLGNIRFISELFKFDVVNDVIVHECILELLTLGDENSLECLCCLLTTVGKELKTRKKSKENNHIMDGFTKTVQYIINKHNIRPRLKFALQDVLNLQQGKCQPRQCHGEWTTVDQTSGIVKEECQ